MITHKTLVDQFLNLQRVNTPLAQVRTADPASVAARITKAAGSGPVVQWDASAGFKPRNAAGKAAIAAMTKDPLVLNAADAVAMAAKAPQETILFIFNAQRLWQDITTAQGIWNLRDNFKATSRMLVMLTTPEATAPREIEGDVIVLDDALPTVDQLSEIIKTQCANAEPVIAAPKDGDMVKATDALKGLSPFVAEQVVALSLTQKGISTNELWDRKRQEIEKTPGATLYTGTEKFEDIGGHNGLKHNLKLEINSKRPIKVVVIWDEFEKMFAGAGSDHVGDGGVAKDAAQVVLTNMQDHKVRGMIMFGHPGAGKTLVAKAMGNEIGCLVITADMGAMKGGVVGESEARVRAFFNMVNAIAGEGGAFFVATCNSTGALTTEIRRRFKSGFYFVDLPERDEKDAIWAIQMKKHNLKSQPLPKDDNWTGAEIEVCCEKADDYGISLKEAAKQIVPVALSQPQLIEARRREAHNSMLSAATGQTYEKPLTEDEQAEFAAPAARSVRMSN